MSMPLQGYRVIELAQIYAGPYCGLQLAHFGAEVIKIEPPGTGELLRHRAPAKHRTNYGFLMLNTGKKSVSLNLKEPRGRDILFKLLEDADVILENYAPGALERLGLGYDDLAPRFPRLVYASSKGYGHDSRFAQLGAMDFTIQAASGIISMTGYADRPGVRVTAALIDTSTGMHLAAGILAALLERARTGRGRKVEVAMLDVCMPAINGALGAGAGRPQDPPPRQPPSHHLPLQYLSVRRWRNLDLLSYRSQLASTRAPDEPRGTHHASRLPGPSEPLQDSRPSRRARR